MRQSKGSVKINSKLAFHQKMVKINSQENKLIYSIITAYFLVSEFFFLKFNSNNM